MLFIDGGLVTLVLWVFCLIDVIVTEEWRVRNLPKLVWLLIVILIPDIGSIAWLIAGHPWQSRTRRGPKAKSSRGTPGTRGEGAAGTRLIDDMRNGPVGRWRLTRPDRCANTRTSTIHWEAAPIVDAIEQSGGHGVEPLSTWPRPWTDVSRPWATVGRTTEACRW